MSYRYDRDLEFLGEIASNDLNDLVFCITRDKDGDTRLSEMLTCSAEYKAYYPDHHKYWKLIAEELQLFGGNTFVNMFRGGKGVLYREVLTDVCDKMKVNYNKNADTRVIETNLLMKVLMDGFEKLAKDDPAEFQKLCDELKSMDGLKNTIDIANIKKFSPEVLLGVFQAAFRAGGFASYQLTVIVVNAVMKAIFGRGLVIAGNAALVRAMSILCGPIGWALTALWTVVDIAGPAYRVTIPAVMQVTYLRQKYMYVYQKEA